MFIIVSKNILLSPQQFTLHEKRVLMLALHSQYYDAPRVEIDSQNLGWAYDLTTECALETLRSSALNLAHRTIQHPVDENKNLPWVKDVAYESGTLRFTLTDELREIQDSHLKFGYDLSSTWGLTMKAWRLMEILTVYSQLKNPYKIAIKLDTFHRVIGATPRQKANFSQLRIDIIDPSVDLLSKNLQYEVTYEAVKIGKPVVDLIFTLTPRW